MIFLVLHYLSINNIKRPIKIFKVTASKEKIIKF